MSEALLYTRFNFKRLQEKIIFFCNEKFINKKPSRWRTSRGLKPNTGVSPMFETIFTRSNSTCLVKNSYLDRGAK